MKKGLLLLAVFTVGVLLASCKKDPPPLVENPNLIFNPKGVQSLNIDQGPETTPFTVNILRTMGRDKAVTVNLAIDETRLPTGKKLLDAKYYTIDNLAVPMASGSGSVSFTVTFKSELMFDEITDEAEWDDYAVPVSIASVSPEFPVVADDTFVVINATLRGATIISEGTEEFAEVSPSGEDGTIELIAKANFSADAAKVSYTVDEAGVAAYNTENETELTLLPASAYSVGTGAWSTVEENHGTDEEPNMVEVDVISNTITIDKSVAAGIYLLPLKITTSEEGVEVDQTEPIYILVEAVPAAVSGQVTNGDFSAPLPYILSTNPNYWYDPEGIMVGAPGVWKHKYEWLSDDQWSTPESPAVDAVFQASIAEGGGSDGSNCLLIECTEGSFDYVLAQKITGLDPAKMYTLSAKAKMADVTKENALGARVGYWQKGNLELRGGTFGDAYNNSTGAWGDVSCQIGNINDNGEVIIGLRFGGTGADTNGKVYFDDVKIEEYIPAVVGELADGDFENTIPLDTSSAPSLPSNSPGQITDAINAFVPGKWILFSGWTLSYGTATQESTGSQSGSKHVKFTVNHDGIDGGYLQKITGLTPGDIYTVSAWAKSENVTRWSYSNPPTGGSGWYPKEEGAHLVWWKYNEETDQFQTRPESTECIRNVSTWTEMTLDVTVPDTGEIVIGVRVGGTNSDMDGTFWFDNVTMTKK